MEVTYILIFLQPKIQVASKYERRVDTKSYDDKKKLFEGVSIFSFNYYLLVIHSFSKNLFKITFLMNIQINI